MLKLCILCAAEWQEQNPSHYFREWDARVHWIYKATAFQQIRALAEKQFNVFINLCDACIDEDEAGIQVVEALEHFNLPFTGARSDFYDPSRATMKYTCQHFGIQTPPFLFVTTEGEAEGAAKQLRFPLIVKHPNGHSSNGLLKESCVENADQLRVQVRRMIEAYGGALIEEFIAGREFDVLVVENADDPTEPFAYQPVEFLFPPNESFKHYDLKWVDYDSLRCVPCDDPVLAARLQAMAKKMFIALNGSGYGRCDFRMDSRGELYLLEINPNCGVFFPEDELGSADFILAQHPGGHRDFIERIIRAAHRVCLAGATGWAGSTLARGIAQSNDIELVAAVSRTYAGRILGDVLAVPRLTCSVYATAEQALVHSCDVFFEYTKPESAKVNIIAALQHGAHVVVGTSGLTDADYADIAIVAERQRRGVLAVGNFALTVVLLQKFAEIAARYIPQWEIIDYASDTKKDSPSGTVRELAFRLSQIRESEMTVPLDQTQGVVETRGARMTGSQVHSVRLPGYTISAEVIFGMSDQKLTIRHDAGSSAQPYVDGALLAIRKVNTFVGLRRGLDSVLDLG